MRGHPGCKNQTKKNTEKSEEQSIQFTPKLG
jgi:hypothetical protein